MRIELAKAAVAPLDLGIAEVIRVQFLEKLHHLLHVGSVLLDQKKIRVFNKRFDHLRVTHHLASRNGTRGIAGVLRAQLLEQGHHAVKQRNDLDRLPHVRESLPERAACIATP